MEGYLPPLHAALWTAAAVPFVAWGGWRLTAVVARRPEARLQLAAVGAFVFVLTALKLPSVAGSSSHPTGTGLGALVVGPSMMTAVATIVLLFQALLLAHGGLTTLGANVIALGVVGPWAAYAAWRALRRFSTVAAVFIAAMVGTLATYATTALQLALAFPDPASGVGGALAKFLAIFALTQVPLAVIEAMVTVVAFQALAPLLGGGLGTAGLAAGGAEP